MTPTTPHHPEVSHVRPAPPKSGLQRLAESFRRSLLAENKSPRTIETYGEALRLLDAFLARRDLPRDPRQIKREHVEAFLAEQLARWKPATASNRYRGLRSFFR